MGSPFCGCSSSVGWISQSKSCSSAVSDHLLFVLAELAGVGRDAGLDGQRVLAQPLGLGEFAEKIPGLFAIEH